MLWTILIAIFFAITIVAAIFAVRKNRQIKATEKEEYGRVSNGQYDGRAWAVGVTVVAGFLGLLLLGFMIIIIVGIKNVGIVIVFG